MLYALGQPASLAGLLAAFLLGLGLRALAQALLARWLTGSTRPGSPLPTPRKDVDPFGAVAALLGGTGWGRAAPLPPTPRWNAARGRRMVVLLAGPLVPLAAGLATLSAYRYAYPGGYRLELSHPSDVLHGVIGPAAEQVLLSLGVGLVCFGLLALIPLPPLDGWGLLWLAVRQPGDTGRTVQHWLADRNLGVVVLLLMLWVPLGGRPPLAHVLFDLVGAPLVELWV